MATLSTRRNAAQQIVLPTTGDGGEALSENFAWIDALQGGVKDRTDTPPGSPSEGDLYILTGTPTGDWTAQAANDIALYYNSGWQFFTPPSSEAGLTLYIIDEDSEYRWDGSAWGSVSGGGLADVVDDTTPQLGGNLDVQANSITTSTSNGSITLSPDGTGDVVLGNFTLDGDQSVGAGQDNYVLTYDHSSGKISLEVASGGGGIADVVDDTSPQLGGTLDVNGNAIGSVSNQNVWIRPNGSGNLYLADNNSGSVTLGNGSNTITLSGTAIDISPTGTGDVTLGNFTFDGDQTVGAGQDNYVLTYDHSAGTISLEAASAAGLSDVVDDTSPQLGGNLDLNSYTVGDASPADLTKLSELTATSTELNYVDGVTSDIQTQIDGKAAASHSHATTDITSGTFADARVAESNVTQHEAALTITESQISDLQSYILSLLNDLTPQLGGDLDVNGNDIISVSNGDINLNPDGTGQVKVRGVPITAISFGA